MTKLSTLNQLRTAPSKLFKQVLDTEGKLAKEVYKNLPDKKRYMGAVPRVFLRKIEKDQQPKVAMQIKELFANVAKEFSESSYPISKQNSKNIIHNLRHRLSVLIKQPVRICRLNKGMFGQGLYIKIRDKEYVLKTFFKDSVLKHLTQHGGHVEPQLAQYISKNTNSGFAAKFIFGKVAPDKTNDAYMVSRYITKKQQPTINHPALRTASNPIKITDVNYNKIIKWQEDANHKNGIIFDFGSAVLKEHFPKDKKTVKFIRLLCKYADYGNVESIKKLQQANQNNPQFQEALKYLQLEKRENLFFTSSINKNLFSKKQKKALYALGFKEFKPTTTERIAETIKKGILAIKSKFM